MKPNNLSDKTTLQGAAIGEIIVREYWKGFLHYAGDLTQTTQPHDPKMLKAFEDFVDKDSPNFPFS